MDIRFAQEQDVSGILALLRQVGQVHHQGRPDLFRDGAQKYGASQVLAMLDSSKTPVFVAVDGNQVLGYVFCQMKPCEHHPVFTDRLELYIDDLCIDQAHRREGIGQALFQAVKKYAAMRHCDYITLNVWRFNDSAMSFYEKAGFIQRNITMEMKL